MQQKITQVKRALISVSNKKGIVEFAKGLRALNIEILSTGGTSQVLRDAGINVRDVSDVTSFPEIMDGRVKTLHPKVHGAILGIRNTHASVAKEHDIEWIDLVVVNLYPFAETIAKPDISFDEAIENIDIGGPAMIRSAAKNLEWVGVVVDPNDYQEILDELSEGLSAQTRVKLATKAFLHTAEYDRVIHQYLTKSTPSKTLQLQKHTELRYGENPHQKASAFTIKDTNAGILQAIQHQGKALSYNNIGDADAAFMCVNEYKNPAAVIVKHANPCGAAVADTIQQAFHKSFIADSTSAFGGIVALNRSCDVETAKQIVNVFFEVVIAPDYSKDALKVLSTKPNLRVLQLAHTPSFAEEYKFIRGGVLIQDRDPSFLSLDNLELVTKLAPREEDLEAMLFAWPVLKQLKSNAILIAKDNATVGVGVGQVSRIDAVDIAVKKAGENIKGSILASDAFFPFRDSIDHIAGLGITAILQPGGSQRDEEVIAACNQHGIAMVFTGLRCFKH